MNKITDGRIGVSIAGRFRRFQGEDAPKAVATYTEWAKQTGDVLRGLEGQLQGIAADEALSVMGRAEKQRDVAVRAMEEIDNAVLTRAESEAATRLASIEKQFEEQVAPADEPNAVAQAGEIRRHVAQMGKTERFSFLRENAGDVSIAAAVLGARPFLSGMDDDEHARFRSWSMEALLPGSTEELDTLAHVQEAGEGAHRIARKIIAERAGVRRSRDGARWLAVHEQDTSAATPSAA